MDVFVKGSRSESNERQLDTSCISHHARLDGLRHYRAHPCKRCRLCAGRSLARHYDLSPGFVRGYNRLHKRLLERDYGHHLGT